LPKSETGLLESEAASIFLLGQGPFVSAGQSMLQSIKSISRNRTIRTGKACQCLSRAARRKPRSSWRRSN